MEYLQKEADVLKVEARSGFVEDVDGFARGPLAELGGQFYPLALTAREGGARLSEFDVTHTHRLDSLELSVDFRVVLEELGGHIHRHLQLIGRPEAQAAYRDRIIAPLRNSAIDAVTRARAAGQWPGPDPAMSVDLMIGAVAYRLNYLGHASSLEEAFEVAEAVARRSLPRPSAPHS